MPEDITALLELYPKKINRKSFEKIRAYYRKQTGHDLCNQIILARKDTVKQIDTMDKQKLAKDLRVSLFKLVDYSLMLQYCPVEK